MIELILSGELFLVICLIILLYFLRRNRKVCAYMKEINRRHNNDIDKLLCGRSIEKTYTSLLFSIKPLKDKYWVK
jgi:uncharacterized membrane protein